MTVPGLDRILVVENDRELAAVVDRFLKRAGYRAVVATRAPTPERCSTPAA